MTTAPSLALTGQSTTIQVGKFGYAVSDCMLDSSNVVAADIDDLGNFEVDGPGNILQSNLTLTAEGYDPAVPTGGMINNGAMTESNGSIVTVGTLEGTGNISLYSDSNLAVQSGSAATSETISLNSSHLWLGAGAEFADPGMQFLAPVYEDAQSSVALGDTTAAIEVDFLGSNAIELFTSNWSPVAEMTVANAAGGPVWATQSSVDGAPAVYLLATAAPPAGHITAYDVSATGHITAVPS
jgi:hypothetical protein